MPSKIFFSERWTLGKYCRSARVWLKLRSHSKLALAAAIELHGREDMLLLSAGSDGVDGNSDDAGALVDGGTVGRGEVQGMDARAHLESADANPFLAESGDLIHTDPTGTNVMDIVIACKEKDI